MRFFESYICLLVSDRIVTDGVRADLLWLVILVNFHLILSVFSFGLIILLWRKDA